MRYSYLDFIKKYHVVIPKIQRDYAYGRTDIKSQSVRKNIVTSLINAVDPGKLQEKKKPFFYFVYGREDDKNTNGSIIDFIPFDGQQRLTTMYLFHLYLSAKVGKKLLENQYVSYATRMASEDFSRILSERFTLPSDDMTIKDHIFNQSWFDSEWMKDPTVSGMIVMLEEIHTQLKGKNWDWGKALENMKNITFDYIDMGDNKLPDSVYMTMNSRGKKLTSFENFKANLEEYLVNHKLNALKERFVGKDGKYNIDGKWLDFFYEYLNTDNTEKKIKPDSTMLSFFRRHLLNLYDYKVSKEGNNREQEDKDVRKYLEEKLEDDEFVPFEKYEQVLKECQISASEWLDPIFTLFNRFSDKDKREELLECTKYPWDDPSNSYNWNIIKFGIYDNKEKLPSRLVFWAVMCFLKKKNRDYDKDNLKEWMRVVWNLIENSTLNVNTSFRTIAKLSECLNGDFMLKLSEFDTSKASEQLKEEVNKAKIWTESKDDIKEAENYAFFKGAIRFLFDKDNKFDQKKWENAQKFFDKDGVAPAYQTGDNMLLQAIIKRCNYFWDTINRGDQIFTNKGQTWKNGILLYDKWKDAVDSLLESGNAQIEEIPGLNDEAKQICVPGVLEWAVKKDWNGNIYYRDSGSFHCYKALRPKGSYYNMICFNPILEGLHQQGHITYKDKEKVISDWCVCDEEKIDFIYHSKANGDMNLRWKLRAGKGMEYFLCNDDWNDQGEQKNCFWDQSENNIYNDQFVVNEFEDFIKLINCKDRITSKISELPDSQVFVWQNRICIEFDNIIPNKIFIDAIFNDKKEDLNNSIVIWSREDNNPEFIKGYIKNILTKIGCNFDDKNINTEGRYKLLNFDLNDAEEKICSLVKEVLSKEHQVQSDI